MKNFPEGIKRILSLAIFMGFIVFAFGLMAESQLIVDWGHDWGNGWYRQVPERNQNGPWKSLAEEDLNDSGTTDDSFIGGWGFSMDEPLSPTNIIYDYSYPSAPFYGAAVVSVTDIPKKEDGEGYLRARAPTEGHINQNHELRDDWNLMCFPIKNREPELARYSGALLVVWKKSDFLNGGDRFGVSFGEDSYIGVFISRYWGGINWGRWVIQDGGQFYISEATFAGQTEQFDIDPGIPLDEAEKLPNGAKNPVVRTTHTIKPGATRWASYNPQAPHHIMFDVSSAKFANRDFGDVQSVGFLAQRDMSVGRPVAGGLWKLPHGIGEPIALKFNAVQVKAEIASPSAWSKHLEMLPVGPAGKPAFYAAKTETSYKQWLEVWRWAVTNQRCRNYTEGFESNEIPGYSFLKDGAVGSAETGLAGEYRPSEPVTSISWYDAVLWCNALSELEGLTPAYYDDAEYKIPVRVVFDRSKLEAREVRKPVYWKRNADGYRLPTRAEFALALADDKPGADKSWIASNSGGRTHPGGIKAANRFGLHDLLGNVAEFIWDSEADVYDPAKQDWHIVLGGSFRWPDDENASSPMPFGERPFEDSCSIGFRVFRNGSGTLSKASADNVPSRRIQAGQLVKAAKQPDIETMKKLVMAKLSPVTFSTAGTLPDNENYKREYRKGGESYNLAFAKVETPYYIWNIVRQWAMMEKNYIFNHAGDMGSTQFNIPELADAARSPEEPVTNITWPDALVWCNALSELFGRTPVYFDKKSGELLRDASCHRLPMYAEYAYPNTGRYHNRPLDTAAVLEIKTVAGNNGFRLPTLAEFGEVHQENKDAEAGWFISNSGMKTHPVGSRQANAKGLFDLDGNVKEMTYGGCGLFGQIRFGNSFGCAPGVYPHSMTRKDKPSVGRPYVGFRVVSRPE